MRIKITNFAIIFIFCILFLGLFNSTIIQGKKFRDLSDKNCLRLFPQFGSRGKVLDRNGNVILGSRISYDAMILLERKDKIERTLTKLSEILGIETAELKNKFKKEFINYSLPVSVVEDISLQQAIALEELKLELPGLMIQPHPLRSYPYGRLAAHVLGYLGEIDRWRLTKLADYGYNTKDIVGFGGVEEKYDYYLRQEEGGMLVEVDHQGRLVRVLGLRPPKNGKELQLTLDLNVQKIIEEKLEDRRGSVIILDPYNGEIIALANRPNFDPSVFIKKSATSINELLNDPHGVLLNRSISGVYPAGSVFKVIVASAALETRKINFTTSFFCPGSARIGRRQFSCWDTHHQQDLMQGITHSCDVFFYHTGLVLGAQLIHDYALKFGLSRPTGIELPYEASGLVPSPLWKRISRRERWYDGDTANFSIGQGDLLVTPLQMCRAMGVFANRGRLVNPHIVKAIDGEDISVYYQKTAPLAIKETNLNFIRESLRRAVLEPSGTANVLSDVGVAVAGKTGTVQVPQGSPHGWFVGFFPYENPRFVISVFLEHGGSSLAACIVTKQIIEEMVKEGLI
ncbi:MAG: penicillin-binding protein 2 [Candidatus Omnitrophica bacterium]|nr:penicillin-binding protein 2 [Candidatus Omnitrophota bacterium]